MCAASEKSWQSKRAVSAGPLRAEGGVGWLGAPSPRSFTNPSTPTAEQRWSASGEEHFGDPGRVKRQVEPGHTTSWTVWFFTEKIKGTRAGRSGGTARITGLVSLISVSPSSQSERKVKLAQSCPTLCTPWTVRTVARSLSMNISRPEY